MSHTEKRGTVGIVVWKLSQGLLRIHPPEHSYRLEIQRGGVRLECLPEWWLPLETALSSLSMLSFLAVLFYLFETPGGEIIRHRRQCSLRTSLPYYRTLTFVAKSDQGRAGPSVWRVVSESPLFTAPPRRVPGKLLSVFARNETCRKHT